MATLLTGLIDGIRLYHHYLAALRELRSYSVVELNGLGLAPADVARVAMEEAERRLAAEHAPLRPRLTGAAAAVAG